MINHIYIYNIYILKIRVLSVSHLSAKGLTPTTMLRASKGWQLESYVCECCGPHQQRWVRNFRVCHFFRAMLKYKKWCTIFNTIRHAAYWEGYHIFPFTIWHVSNYDFLTIYSLICHFWSLAGTQRHEIRHRVRKYYFSKLSQEPNFHVHT